MKIEETDEKVIINGHEIDGFIDEERNCNICNTYLVYYEDYDAYFCPKCNFWTEKKCGDTKCDFCAKRPDTPLPL
ncbi:hypothetical protein FZW96_21420 [Bacillus sp. BGMRC 2118]|nr:hypothetical protein FZW96_21420 [Bacillus sp. BGMRC 2118]